MARHYKYNCRACIPRVRSMCIQEAQISPGSKLLIERAFESHTDTEATWDLLQANCLLVQRDQAVIDDLQSGGGGLLRRMGRAAAPFTPVAQPAEPPPQPTKPSRSIERGSLLERMRRRAQEHQDQGEQVSPPVARPVADRSAPRRTAPRAPTRPGQKKETGSLARREPMGVLPEPASALSERSTTAGLDRASEPPATAPTVSPEQRASLLDRLRAQEATGAPLRPVTSELERVRKAIASGLLLGLRYPPAVRPTHRLYDTPGPKMLVVQSSGHRIRLPENGELILGRLDPLSQVKPDIDLTFEDQAMYTVSRRHASVTGWHGRYEVTDLGSSNGTWVNGQRLDVQRTTVLHIGDEVRLGQCVLYLDRAPDVWAAPPQGGRYFLYVAFSGHYFALPERDVITIGRSDPVLGYTPDIDLSDEGDAASVVSRRHARLIRDGERFVVEEMGSAFRTKIDGQPVHIGMQVPIRLGQHLWLGGCVLAFDVI